MTTLIATSVRRSAIYFAIFLIAICACYGRFTNNVQASVTYSRRYLVLRAPVMFGCSTDREMQPFCALSLQNFTTTTTTTNASRVRPKFKA